MNSMGTNGDRSVQNAASGRASAGGGAPGGPVAARAGLGGEAVAEGTVADLVVVLREDDELVDRAVVVRRSERSLAERGELARMEHGPTVGLPQLGERPELLVVAVALAGEHRAQRVV